MAWRRAPLWFRLVASLVGLAALALTISGLAGARLLRGYLVDRVDQQLRSAAVSLAEGEITEDDAASRLPSPYHVSVYRPDGGLGAVRWSPLENREDSPRVPRALTPEQARNQEGRPFTLADIRGHGSWRAVTLAVQDQSGNDLGTVLVATNLSEVEATVDRLQHISLLVGLSLLAGLALAGYGIVRSALRHLTEIEQTAAAITRGDLSRRVPDVDPATEIGRVGRGLNTMLDQIEGAFDARESSEATARRSEARMRRFVADASHELRTPLTSIRGFAELYRQMGLTDPEALGDVLRRIEDEATRMGLLVDDLLLLARLDTERPFAAEPVDLVELAREAAEAGRIVARDRTIELVVPADGSPVVVVGDDSRLRQLVGNLVDNAIRHTAPGVDFEVRVGIVAKDGRRWAELAVADHGQGLTPEQALRVFERFYRTDTARSRKGPSGAGLGLSIVQAVATAHGGHADVDSSPGEGATFQVLLPLASAEEDELRAPSQEGGGEQAVEVREDVLTEGVDGGELLGPGVAGEGDGDPGDAEGGQLGAAADDPVVVPAGAPGRHLEAGSAEDDVEGTGPTLVGGVDGQLVEPLGQVVDRGDGGGADGR
jgi:two-component system OmpR family sensor kinase